MKQRTANPQNVQPQKSEVRIFVTCGDCSILKRFDGLMVAGRCPHRIYHQYGTNPACRFFQPSASSATSAVSPSGGTREQ
jgi:hypothetical protein